MRPRRVAVLGSTGSIGRSTLDVIAAHPDRLALAGVAARTRTELLARQIARFRPPLVAVWDEERKDELQRLAGSDGVRTGLDGLTYLATHPDIDIVVLATSGCDSLIPLVQAIRAGKRIALATKELLVTAGELVMRLVQEHGTTLMPIDSEHAALAQCLAGVPAEQVERLVITGSGGPLWGKSAAELGAVTREQVLAHPKWSMGPKITVDSATLMNKGLEVIEAHWLFGVPLDRLQVVIHPEAAVHALVELADGTLLAQMSPCDMRLPIQYALSAPERWAHPWPRLRLTELSALRFFAPDRALFPCLDLALKAAAAGGTACAVLNASNEAAVRAYLDGYVAFTDIPRVIAETLGDHDVIAHPSLEEVLEADRWARKTAQERIHQCSPR